MRVEYRLIIEVPDGADEAADAALDHGIFEMSERIWDEVGPAPWGISVLNAEGDEVTGYRFEGDVEGGQ